ncbi:hypothetical protein ACOME3_003474 [Neoechinorhynchus agilis]
MEKIVNLGLKAAKAAGLNPSESGMVIDTIFKQLDKDGNGSIDFPEMQDGLARLQLGALGEKAAKELFSKMDTNQDDRISKDEFSKIVHRASEMLHEKLSPEKIKECERQGGCK